MSLVFNTNIDLTRNEIQNFVVQKLAADPVSPIEGLVYYNTTISRLKLYTGGQWLILEANTGGSTTITDIVAGNQISVTVTGGIATIAHGNTGGATSPTLNGANVLASITFDSNGHVTGATSRALTLADLGYTGATDADNYANWRIGANSGAAQDVPTNGLVTIEGEDGVETEMAAGRVVKIALNSTVVRTSGAQTIGGNKVFSDNVTVEGNLTVNGTTTTVNSETVNIDDSLLYLNSGLGAVAPSVDSGFVANRGSAANVAWAWVEALGAFVAREVGSFEGNTGTLPTTGAFASVRAGATLVDTLGIDAPNTVTTSDRFLTYNPTTKEVSIIAAANLFGAIKQAATTSATGVVELATDAEVAAGTDQFRAVTPSGLASMSFKQTFGNGTATTFTFTHNFNTLDVQVEVIQVSNGATIYTDVKRTVNTVVIATGSAPASNAYRVLIRRV